MRIKQTLVRTSPEALGELFGLPEGVEIVGVRQTDWRQIEFTIVSNLELPLPEDVSLQSLFHLGQAFLNPKKGNDKGPAAGSLESAD